MTQTQIRKTGIVERWMGRYGFIFVTYKERYFMPIVEFDAPRCPVAGERVEFEFTPAPVIPGLPQERNLPVPGTSRPLTAHLLKRQVRGWCHELPYTRANARTDKAIQQTDNARRLGTQCCSSWLVCLPLSSSKQVPCHRARI